MKSERLDNELSRIFEQATPPTRPEMKARVVQSLQHLPARPRRKRILALAVGAVILLAGLGFVPFPAGNATGAWARAIAQMMRPVSVHIVERWYGNSEANTERSDNYTEEWKSANGFFRREERYGQKVEQLTMDDKGRRIIFYGIRSEMTEVDLPPKWASASIAEAMMPTESYLTAFLPWIQSAVDVKIHERRKRTLWRGAVDIVDIEGTVKKPFVGSYFFGGGSHWEGDRFRIHAEIDPDTDHLLSVEEYRYETEDWEPRHWRMVGDMKFDWLDKLPIRVYSFTPPKGTTITKFVMWKGRTEKTIATESTGDWRIALHALEVNRNGDLYVTISKALSAKQKYSLQDYFGSSLKAEAKDDEGAIYTEDVLGNRFARGYYIVVLRREKKPGIGESPKKVNITIYPSKKSEQSVTFDDQLLPPRQLSDDLIVQSKVIQLQ